MAIEPRNTSTTNLAPEPTAGQAPAAPDSAQLPSADRATVQLTLGHAVLIALVVGIFAVVWLAAITQLSTLIWKNSFVAANRWAIPVAAVFFALLVGLAQKYLHAPTVINGGALEALAPAIIPATGHSGARSAPRSFRCALGRASVRRGRSVSWPLISPHGSRSVSG